MLLKYGKKDTFVKKTVNCDLICGICQETIFHISWVKITSIKCKVSYLCHLENRTLKDSSGIIEP